MRVAMLSKPTAPLNKVDFYERYKRLEFGNRPHIFETVEELEQFNNGTGKKIDLISVRSKTPGGKCLYNIKVDAMLFGSYGKNKGRGFVFQESLPDECLLIQGNVTLDEIKGLSLEYSLERNLKYREAMLAAKFECGLKATFILKQYLDASSYDCLMELLSQFEKAIIEFATYDKNIGVIPHRNTVIFECRMY